MIPIRIYLENFMSYRQGQELLFDSAPLWVLAGENGAGKSTIFDAITFALYGSCRGVKQEELINHQEDSFVIEFDFLIIDKQYRIRRTVSKRGLSTRQISEIFPEERIKPISNTDKDIPFKNWISRNIGLDEKAFTSCVLLSQGQSDKLLNASKDDTKEVLEKIIDISVYKQLHEKADNLRKDANRDFERLTKELKNIPLISNEQLQLAQEQLDRAKQDYQIIQERVEKLNQIIQQAKQWEQLQQNIKKQNIKKQEFQQLIDRSVEIDTNFNHLEELKLVIPKLKDIILTKERLTNAQQEINNIEQNFQQLKNHLTQAETEQKKSNKECDRLQQSIEDLQTNLQQVSTNLSEIAPLISKLEQYEQIKSNLENCDREIAKFPLNLSQQVSKQEKQYQQIIEIRNILPWLENIAESKSNLGIAIKQQQAVEEYERSLDAQLTENKQYEQQLNINLKKIEQTERDLSERVKLEQANYQRINKQLQNFEKATIKSTCELCGQEITAEHAQQEKPRLNRNSANIQANLNSLTTEYSKAKQNQAEHKTNLENCQSKIKAIEEEVNQNQSTQRKAQSDIQSQLKQLDKAWDNLPVSYQVYISPSKPHSESEWLDLSYPSNSDLSQLKEEVKTIDTLENTLNALKQQLEQWKKLDNQSQTYSKQLAESEAEFSVTEAKQAQKQYQESKQVQEDIKNNIQRTKQVLKQARINKETADNNVQDYLKRSQQEQQALTRNQTICETTKISIQEKSKELPQQWQETVDFFDDERLQELQQQRDELIEYENLQQRLNTAQQSLEYLSQQINSCQKQIEQLPIEAHRLSPEIEQEIETAKEERGVSETNKSNAERELNKLKDTQEQHKKLQEETNKAERNSSLYKTLSNLLGKKGIQLHILRNAEKAIIEIANEILDSLSRGNIRLELREENEGIDKALDLVAYNFATGEKPTAVALTSGSQRFRIAVSLALAIGQYVGNSARNIESVIIDEGFGSLDKNGRDDMIQELNELKQRLKRIILVSHQEEFFSEFTNGYKVKLVEGASHVSLLESSF